MQTQNINVTYQGQPLVGFEFSKLPLGAALLVASQQVDLAADQARLVVMGDPLRALEYQLTAQEAEAFALADYADEAPPTVQAWMDASNLDAQQATDGILAEARVWKSALYAIRATRLKAKHEILNASSHDLAETIASEAIAAIQATAKDVGN